MLAHLEHPTVRQWGEGVMEERKELWESRGRGEEEQTALKGARVGAKVDEAAAANSQS